MTARAARLLDRLEAHRATVTAQLDATPSAIVHTRPRPTAWSLVQIADHLLRIDQGLLLDGPPMSGASRRTSGLRSRGVQAVLSLPLRIPAPPSAQGILPSRAPDWSLVRTRWEKVRGPWRVARPQPGAVAYRHPLAGPLGWDDALAFLLAHHRHHDAQIRRTLAALARRV